ncbi:FAD/NAD(P)-binding domain-containing protein [Ramaria rubella]|nr:FAD/NAD(P)-binding domain-containing protein [Ramaria rubella]
MAPGRVTRICIIGGGAAGLAILKTLRETPEYRNGTWELVVFETRSELGGVWLPAPPLGNPPSSPIYDALTTNLPHPVMAFSSFWFEPSTPLFPAASVVIKYLQDYATHFHLSQSIRFNQRVSKVSWDGQFWNLQTENGDTQRFDKVVVANGHYSAPRYPSIPGVDNWLNANKAVHSVFFRNAQPYQGNTILVIGNGPSGQDICAEVSKIADIVYHSISAATPEDQGNIRRRGGVVQFQDEGTVMFEDGSSVSGIDYAILATGYIMSFPFLPQLRQGSMPEVPPLPSSLVNSAYSVFPLARHIFPLQDDFPADTIAFVGLLIRVAPFPVFEAQGKYIAKVFAQPGFLDTTEESVRVVARYAQLHRQWGDDPVMIAKQWHKLPDSQQFSYRIELLDLVGAPHTCYPEDWAEELYSAKGELRAAWIKLENNGQASEWVKGVGEGGRHEWIIMMRRLLVATRTEQMKEA